MQLKVGFLTIGQSPRTDIVKDVREILSKNIKIVEKGVLDELDQNAIAKNLAPEPTHTIYVSRLRNGSQVAISKEKILPLMQRTISKLEEEEVDLIVILCSGEFPMFKSNVPIMYPDRLLKSYVQAFDVKGSLGVLIPLPEQVEYAMLKWRKYSKEVLVVPVSP